MTLPDFVKTPYVFEGKVHLVEKLYPSSLYELCDPYLPEKVREDVFDRLKEGGDITTAEIIEMRKEYLLNSRDQKMLGAAGTPEEAKAVTPHDKKRWSQRWLLEQFNQRVDVLIDYAEQSGIFEAIENLDPELYEVLEPIQEKVGNLAEMLWQSGQS